MQNRKHTHNTSAKNIPVRVALAAFGMSGRVFHAPLITSHPDFELTKVLERSGSRHAMDAYPGVESVGSLGDVLSDPAIDLVVINTPEHTHYEMAKKALETGKHVVVEKAFTVTSREARHLIAVAAKRRLVLSVFQNSRFHGDFRTIRQILKDKLLGRVVECEIHYDRYRPGIQASSWKEKSLPGTGTLYNLGVHMIDQALVLFGWPRAVFCDLGIQRSRGKVPDYFELTLYYEGLRVILKSSYLVKTPGPRYILHGTKGSFVKYGTDPQEAMLKAGVRPGASDWGSEPEECWGQLETEIEGMTSKRKVATIRGSYMDYYDNIRKVLRGKATLLVRPEEAMRNIEIIEAALKSNRTRRVVQLDKVRHD